MNSPALLQLRNADCAVKVCPDLGGTITRFTWQGREILRPAPDAAISERLVRQMACYPLVPYSNRIGNAELDFAGERRRLRANAPPEPHALHGFGWQRAWRVESQTYESLELVLQHAADDDWPYACEAVQNLRLTHEELQLALSVRNNGTGPMPAGLGFHPYFPIAADTRLKTQCKGMWQMGPDSLPTELVSIPVEADFSRSRTLEGWRVDNCFTGWNRYASLDYTTHRVELEASAECTQLVCFAPNDGRQFIALEPVSHINNAFALAAKGVGDTGTKTLASGEKFEIAMSIRVSARL